MARIYVKNKDLYNALCESLKQDELTEDAINMCMLMNKEIHTKKLRYYNELDRDDCMQGAMMDVIAYWRNFKPEINGIKTNAFAYITQILKCGSAKVWKKIHPEKTKHAIQIDNIYSF